MSKLQTLRVQVEARLSAAVCEILGLFDRAMMECEEEEGDQQHRQPGALVRREVRLRRADIQQLMQQQWSPSLDLDESESPPIKEEPKELWTSEDGEQHHGVEEAEITNVTVKSEEDQWGFQDTQIHQNQSEENTEEELPPSSSVEQVMTDDDGEECGGADTTRTSDPVWKQSLDQERPKPPYMKEVQEAVLISQEEEEQSPGPKESVKSEDDDEAKIQLSKISTQKGLKRHKGQKLPCSVCGKNFSRNSYLKVHMKMHTGQCPFVCSVCGKKFTRRASRNIHMKLHTGDRPFSCAFCGKNFTLNCYLKDHMLNHTGEKPFSCSVCGKNFTRNSHLKDHMRTHTGEKPFSCSVCGKNFTVSSHLKGHMGTHKGEKQFVEKTTLKTPEAT